MGLPCRGSGEPCPVKPDEQPSDGLEPERSGSDVQAEGISDFSSGSHDKAMAPIIRRMAPDNGLGGFIL